MGFGREPAGGHQPLGDVADLGLRVAGCSSQPVEGGHRIHLVASHQITDTALDDHPIVQRVLQLRCQLAGILSGHRGRKGGFDHVAIATQGLAFVVLPDVRPVVEHVKSADGDRTETHRQTQDRAYAIRAERGGEIRPARLSGHVGARHSGVVDECLSAWALPCLAFHHLKHSPWAVGRGDIAWNVLLIGEHDAATRNAEDPRMPRSRGAGPPQRSCLVRLARRAGADWQPARPDQSPRAAQFAHGAPSRGCGGHRVRSSSTDDDVSSYIIAGRRG